MSEPILHSSVIYFSQEDNCWIAHCLMTDQIGTGISVADSLADLIKAIQQVISVAIKDRDVEICRPAPQDIQDMAKTADPLPGEIYEIAYKMVHGKWPQEFTVVQREVHNKGPLVTKLPEFDFAYA